MFVYACSPVCFVVFVVACRLLVVVVVVVGVWCSVVVVLVVCCCAVGGMLQLAGMNKTGTKSAAQLRNQAR
jgi:hypothetical protein